MRLGKGIACVLLAILLAGCSMPKEPVFTGVHLLADATMRIVRITTDETEVAFSVSVVNAGTETCKEAEWWIDWWPEELKKRLIRESNRGWGMGEVAPGEKHNPTGGTLFDTTGLSESEIIQLLQDLAVTLRCEDNGYTNRVLFSLRDERP
ncbi:hypothetical protein [Symbiobacterium terraclitae]|uniref:hypothetical protein n=1 Tax=Symbiobacterium terraclitae TaxID=557451 RepID=UPI0035B52F4F